ncbi:MAG: cob(I)yrinic acid a,c-diamide adenosyltransferase [Ruminococcus sp.]|uniref:cob(I)yrinic acid a,c-diamide adenosyltransferase n=1 Tax=Ruminococcus sp. TaxID=41978 RepID=UPI001B06A51A|nr:cob(I)yrinic acid a,c-diamide adenosyltransferase [Ruminococcus sp.]MBO7473862.1 cob(I)yrinic acid a,c-diamide adenosyltransferase [Ruminococcus sp.]
MLHIYYGNGKGKTTAAVGLTLRANGSGMKTAFLQFLKNGSSSEISILESLKDSFVLCCRECNKFSFQMSDAEKEAVKYAHTAMLRLAEELINISKAELIVLDELLDAYNKCLIDTELADKFISTYSKKVEIIITGRAPSAEWLDLADYVTEMNAIKHPYNNGINARKGIEY